MPVSNLTLHAYRTWLPDHRRGYTSDAEIHASDPEMADRYRRQAKEGEVQFSELQLLLMLSAIRDIASRRAWRVHAVFGECTHIHFILSWRTGLRIEQVRRVVPNLLSRFLSEQAGEPGRRWFARRPSCRPVKDREHLDYLLNQYRAKHTALGWREGDAPPPPLSELLRHPP
jgi:REP element-mobilizing transposase RayT